MISNGFSNGGKAGFNGRVARNGAEYLHRSYLELDLGAWATRLKGNDIRIDGYTFCESIWVADLGID